MDWLKRAEDLFEVVDRRAKLVASELTDEQSNALPAASNGKIPRGKRSKTKVKKKTSVEEHGKKGDIAQEDNSLQPSVSDSKPNEPSASTVIDNNGPTQGNLTTHINIEMQDNIDNSSHVHVTDSETSSTEVRKHDDRHQGEGGTSDSVVTSSSNGELGNEMIPAGSSFAAGTGVNLNNHPMDSGQSIRLTDVDESVKSGEDNFQPMVDVAPSPVITDKLKVKSVDATSEPISNTMKQDDEKEKSSLSKVQEQLEEAQGLLKSTNPSGKSKEARLARVCAGLSSRVQEYKSENAQLEELLTAERELSKSCEGRIKQLQQELSSAKTEISRVESNMADALAAKNSEIETLVSSLDALKKQAALSEGNMASLQANTETLMRNRELTETRMMQALKEELALAERRAEEERIAHNATKKAAMEREVELEHRAVDASSALARLQRIADERTAKAGELEQKVALLEGECASLNQELHDMEGRLRREQKKSPEDANQLIQMQTWQQEVERARQGQRDAEIKLSSLEGELQKLRVEMAAMKRDAEHYSRQEHMELEKRYRELTDLLYYKQTQLETMASEKAAAEFQLEKENKRLQEAQAEAERSKISRRASSTWYEEAEMRELEPLPLHQRHLAGASIQLRKAAKLLDSGAVSATRILWRHPRARVGLFCYLVFVHLFLMYLLHRLQAQADDFAAQDLVKSMGLSQPNLP